MLTPGFSETSALVAVLEQKSFTKAAEQLGLSPARVSELVRNLEERLGVRLGCASSSAPRVRLPQPQPGSAFWSGSARCSTTIKRRSKSPNDFRSKPAGPLRLTVAPPAADFVLAPVISRFLSQYPEIRLDISVDRAFVDIVEARFDAGIRPGEHIARDMVAVRISDDIPFVAAASSAYVEQHGAPKDSTGTHQTRLHPLSPPKRRVGAVALRQEASNV